MFEIKSTSKGYKKIFYDLRNSYKTFNRTKSRIDLSSFDLKSLKEEIPKESGIYAFYYNENPIYVGTSINLYKRIIRQHLSTNEKGSSSSFRRGLTKKYKVPFIKTKDWIFENCKLKFLNLDNYDDIILMEAFLIKQWRTIYGEDSLINVTKKIDS